MLRTRIRPLHLLVLAALAQAALEARADAVTEWNLRAGEVMTEAKLGTPPATRAMAFVQTAVAEAAIAAKPAGVDAAIAAANRAVLLKLLPAQEKMIEAAYNAALAKVADGPAKAEGIATGEQAAARVLAQRLDDGAATPEQYRPHAAPGAYVPTVIPAVPHWVNRKPWLMASASQFRPAGPPSISSDAWARDFNEVKALGGKKSTVRTEEQTAIAQFWEYSLPPIYYGVVRSVADQPGRDVVRNAKLYAAVAQSMDDAMISVFEAKYHYNFWRPVTAIRNADGDGTDLTQRDASWSSLIDAPMHPEYPSGHSVLAGAIGAVIRADLGKGTAVVLRTTSPSAKGAERKWNGIEEFVGEVGNSRIYAGIHYRTAINDAAATGQKIGELAAARYLAPLRVGQRDFD